MYEVAQRKRSGGRLLRPAPGRGQVSRAADLSSQAKRRTAGITITPSFSLRIHARTRSRTLAVIARNAQTPIALENKPFVLMCLEPGANMKIPGVGAHPDLHL